MFIGKAVFSKKHLYMSFQKTLTGSYDTRNEL